MEDTAGRAYGLDAVTAWPRLYPVLGEQFRSLVDDRRDALDSAVRMAAAMAATALVSLALLLGSAWWMLLALLPAGMAVLAYNGAVQAALAPTCNLALREAVTDVLIPCSELSRAWLMPCPASARRG
jgi:hypothetical protein